MSEPTTIEGWLRRVGTRLKRTRLQRNWTQRALAEASGVSFATIQRLEAGHTVQLDTLLKVLRALDLIAGLDALVPPPPVSPMALLEAGGRRRQRASPRSAARDEAEEAEPWSWGDEP